MIRSMTGFGRGEYRENGKEILVEIKSVNHRYSDFYIKMPKQIAFLEDKVREKAGKYISRGKVDIYISYEDYSDESKNVLVDESLLRAYIKAVELIRDKYGIRDDISVSMFTRLPDILKVEKKEEDEENLWKLLDKALTDALDGLVAMRETEGIQLKIDLLERASYIEGLLAKIEKRAPGVVTEYKQKLEKRIKEILEQQTIDDTRLAMEVAIFAERCSIDEEIVRLGSHIKQLKTVLDTEQPVGRKLDFLIQEMNREINTIGAKANDLELINFVVEIKGEIEKLREQVQNIE